MTVVAINWGETEQEVNGFIKEFKLPFPVTIDKTGDLITKFRARYHPHSVFINKEGVITGIVPGLVTPQMMQDLLAKTL
jgi:thioredoxin-related protein